MGWVRHIERMGKMRGACRVLVRKPKRKILILASDQLDAQILVL
jgi:hypothetical protein